MNREADRLGIVKFRASLGAATRMFKELFEFVNEGKRGKGIDTLLDNIGRFAFWPELKAVLPPDADDKATVRAIVKDGLGYGQKPKGLVTFHAYPEGARKAVEEHLVEGAVYAAARGVARIHFHRVARAHRGLRNPPGGKGTRVRTAFRHPLRHLVLGAETFDRYDCRQSRQHPFPAGGRHAAVPSGGARRVGRETLNEIDADLVFIKNIDNVTTDAQRGDTIRYKRYWPASCWICRIGLSSTLKALEVGGAELEPIVEFIEQRLCVKLPADYDSALLRAVLDRPIRVCGMVRNEGEPGGGPFWASNADGTQSLQIAGVEPDRTRRPAADEGRDAFQSRRPRVRRPGFQGAQKFDLRRYTDPATGFISSKSSGGRELRAQELPGLWERHDVAVEHHLRGCAHHDLPRL